MHANRNTKILIVTTICIVAIVIFSAVLIWKWNLATL